MKISEEKWHALTENEVCNELCITREGLTDDEARQRLAQYGFNTLPVKKPPTLLAILLHQILNPLIFILIAAAVASVAIGESTDAVFILLVIMLNSGLGAYQEYNAETVEARALLLAAEGYRVLALAGGEFDHFAEKRGLHGKRFAQAGVLRTGGLYRSTAARGPRRR